MMRCAQGFSTAVDGRNRAVSQLQSFVVFGLSVLSHHFYDGSGVDFTYDNGLLLSLLGFLGLSAIDVSFGHDSYLS